MTTLFFPLTYSPSFLENFVHITIIQTLFINHKHMCSLLSYIIYLTIQHNLHHNVAVHLTSPVRVMGFVRLVKLSQEVYVRH